MSTIDISSVIDLPNPQEDRAFNLISMTGEDGPYFGKDFSGNICFVIPSYSIRPKKNSRLTNDLVLLLDYLCTFNINGKEKKILSNILVCKSRDDVDIFAFVRLCNAFAGEDLTSQSITDLFMALTRLFSVKGQSDYNTIVGLFGELYTVFYFDQMGIDIGAYWQKKDLMKFDFMIDYKKRIDVKSVIGVERKHHFKHEQLYYEDYDIIISSIMLRESNSGISVYDVVDYSRNKFSSDYKRLSIIENKLSNYSDEDLREIIFDKVYLENNIRFISAHQIPRFNEKSPNNLTNAEYDCNLESCKTIADKEMKLWIKK